MGNGEIKSNFGKVTFQTIKLDINFYFYFYLIFFSFHSCVFFFSSSLDKLLRSANYLFDAGEVCSRLISYIRIKTTHHEGWPLTNQHPSIERITYKG